MKEASLNSWTIIFLIAASQGIFLSILLFLKRNKKTDYLSYSILFFSLMLMYYVGYWTGYNRYILREVGVSMGFTFLVGPLLYFYLKEDVKQKWKHFIPFGIYSALFLLLPFLPFVKIFNISLASLQCLHLTIYAYLIFDTTTKWKQHVSYSFLGYAISFNLYYVLLWTGLLKIEYDYFISIFSCGLIYYVGYQAFLNPKIVQLATLDKYKNSALSDSASNAIFKAVVSYMEDKKGYRDSDLKLSSLADQLGFSPNHISQVVNEKSGSNFSDFINSYRIEEAKKLIIESTEKPRFIEIAYDVGFNNKTSFNNAFKKFTDQSPSSFYLSTTQKMSA